MLRAIATFPRERPAAAAALPLAASLLALAGCGGGTRTVVQSGPPRTTSPLPDANTATAAATATTADGEAPTHVVSLATFQSPSGNIGCVIAAGVARCDIVQRDWQPPARPASCPHEVDFGQGVEVAGRGAGRLVCAGDTARDPSSAHLEYGAATRVGGFECVSRRTGMSCSAAGGHGFELSRQGYRVF
jgi:hypothetical protein